MPERGNPFSAGFAVPGERWSWAPLVCDSAYGRSADNWLTVETLPYFLEIPHTRLYSPDYLERVFGWSRMGSQWDGLLCQVDPPNRVIISKMRNPNCLKWVSLNQR